MNDLLVVIEPLAFFFVAISLFALLGVLGYQKKTGAAFVALLGAVLSASFVYLDHISEIAATATSLTIKVREASDALVGLRKVAALTGAALISDELVPGEAAVVENVVVGFEDAVREPVVAHELPDVLDRIELGRFRRQRQERDVVRDGKLRRDMPPGLIEKNERMRAWCDRKRDFFEMQGHGLAVAGG